MCCICCFRLCLRCLQLCICFLGPLLDIALALRFRRILRCSGSRISFILRSMHCILCCLGSRVLWTLECMLWAFCLRCGHYADIWHELQACVRQQNSFGSRRFPQIVFGASVIISSLLQLLLQESCEHLYLVIAQM